jgi:HK97 family phage major capsid protein
MTAPTLDLATVTTLATEARDKAFGAVTKLNELRSTPADKRGDTFVADVRAAIDDLTAMDTSFEALQRIRQSVAEDDIRGRQQNGNGPSAGTGDHSGPDRRSAGEQFTGDQAYEEWRTKGGSGTFELEVRTLLTSSSVDTPSAGIFMPRGTPFLLPAAIDRRRMFVRDVLSLGTTTLSSVPYIRELSPRTNETGATAVAEGTPKPEVQMQWVQADAPARKIAAWIPATTEILADAPTLRSYIDARLAYMLMLREEDQVLNGSGAAPNILGIRQTAGLQTYAAPAGDNLTGIGGAIPKIELVDGEPDGVALNPTDYWNALLRRAGGGSTGDNHYDLDPFKDPATLMPWGLPPIKTRSMPAGKAIVGAWRIGGQLLDREETVLRVGDQHLDYFINNKVVILVEERVCFLNHRPDFFVEVTFS